MDPTAPPPHPHRTWQEAAYDWNERAAGLAAEIERLGLKVDAAKGETLVVAQRHADFKKRLRDVGALDDLADEGHIVNAMRHARANRAAEERPYEELAVRLGTVLEGHGVTPRPWSASTVKELAAVVEGELQVGRADRKAAESASAALKAFVAEVAVALGMPPGTPAANVVSRAAAVRRELSTLRRDRSHFRPFAHSRDADDVSGDPPTWEDVKADFQRLGEVIGELFTNDGPGGKR